MYRFKPQPNQTPDKDGLYFHITPDGKTVKIKEGETVKEARARYAAECKEKDRIRLHSISETDLG